ncbi:hypothetical protein FBU30_011268 [Linnemannia zychae]|nr:hypothetical protein FBU30_011268 [Linnemannia zychae]
MGYYATIIPISAAVLKFSKPGPMPETNEAMAPKNITSNLHHVSYSVESQRDKRLVTDSQLSNAQPTYATATTSNGAKKASLRVCQNRTEFYFIDHPTQTVSETDETTATLENTNHESLHSSRTSKRRRINTIFTSNERKIEFERVDQELSKWAEQLPEMYKPDRAGHLLEQLDINSISLVIFHYLLVMVLHHPVMMIAKLTSNRCRQGALAETVNRIHAKDIDDGHAIKEAYSETNHADMDMSLRVKCDEAADGITSIIKNFDKDYVKYHGGHHNLPVYLAGTILIMRLSRTDDPMVQSQIQEQLQICSTFLSIAAPYWKEAGEKANALLDQLANYSKRRYTGSDEDEGDEIEDEEEDKDDNDSFDQRGGDVEEEDSTDENNGAEQSLQDLMIADALLDLSNRPPRTDYSFRKAMSLPTLQSPPSIQLTPSMRISRSEPSLSECCQMKTERQSPFRQQPPVLTIPLNASHCRSPLSSTSLPLTHPLSLNSPISQTVIAAKTIANMDSSSLLSALSSKLS